MPYRIVRQALARHDEPITPSFKPSFSRSISRMIKKRFVIHTTESTGLHLAPHPDWAAYWEAMKGKVVSDKGLKANRGDDD